MAQIMRLIQPVIFILVVLDKNISSDEWLFLRILTSLLGLFVVC